MPTLREYAHYVPQPRENVSAKLHCVLISWDGYHTQSAQISAAISDHVDDLTVVYSNAENSVESGAGNWIRVRNDWFYGRKFERALKEVREDEVMLLIQADAHCSDWPAVARGCRTTLSSSPEVGVWSPAITKTPWTEMRVKVASLAGDRLNFVAQTDGVVFGYGAAVLRRLRLLDYSDNNLGWGIDWVAICFSYVNSLFVVTDRDLIIEHEEGQGYAREDALMQMDAFLDQMTPQESLMYVILNSYCHPKVARPRSEVPELTGHIIEHVSIKDSRSS